MLNIVKYPNKILRQIAKPIAVFDDDLAKLAANMAEVMYADDGIGLAGPQIDLSKRILVIGHSDGKSYKVYINPEITFSSKDFISTEEGCLSLPKIFGLVSRAKKIRLKYQDLTGKVHKEKAKGFPAVVLQHEIDHLNGVLFIDRASEITQGQDILDQLKAKN
jgi:peptide deformylase